MPGAGAVPDEHARDKAPYLSWLTEAYLTAGDVEQTAATTGRALELSTDMPSTRPRQRIRAIPDQLRVHADVAEVREVLALADAKKAVPKFLCETTALRPALHPRIR